MTSPFISVAIAKAYPEASFSIVDDDSAKITWSGPGTKPTDAQIQTALDAYSAAQNKVATYRAGLDAGHVVAGVTYGIKENDQANWTAALVALDSAEKVQQFDPSTTYVQNILGPILDKSGTPVGNMTVTQFRGVMLAITQRIGQLRAALYQ